MFADLVPDSRGLMLRVNRGVVANGAMPTAIGGHVDPKDGALYGGVIEMPGCNYLESLVANDKEARENLRLATADPQGYTDRLAKLLSTQPDTKGTTVKDWVALGFAGASLGAMASVGTGVIGHSRGGDLQFKTHGPGQDYGQDDDGSSAPSAGGNVHGNGASDVHGNPWQGTGSGSALGKDVHGNQWNMWGGASASPIPYRPHR